MIFVVDASVVAKWVLQEEYTDEAIMIRDKYINGEVKLYAPPLIRYEVSNTIWKAVTKRKVMSLRNAIKALENIFILLPKIIKLKRKDFIRALKLATKYDITVYDATYLVLKEITGGIFVTADKKLFRKIKKIKDVVFISDIRKYLS